jgi:hypothetical protein
MPGSRRRTRFIWLAVLAAVLVLGLNYVCLPRQADLTHFDPQAMARRETLMWRHYYQKRYFALFRDLYDVSRRQYRFSPLDSLRLAYEAASAARSFQPSNSRAEAEAALPALRTYFRLLARGAKHPIDIEDAARTELAWWQARREAATPEQYGAIVARVTALLYGIDNEDIRRSGLLRAQAMDYRDAHGANMTRADWAAIREQLLSAYAALKKGVSAPAS